ncbi:metabotropic glutamate receptor 5-like [Physella acuta]|uniref:metabotropic glutamate receptor 5-like n=1 Tax=Physella acuta TaxID=109671 RepID=UPI0027DE6672|nr:metabotropic glutamate receptor 5-like [Physella acuta]
MSTVLYAVAWLTILVHVNHVISGAVKVGMGETGSNHLSPAHASETEQHAGSGRSAVPGFNQDRLGTPGKGENPLADTEANKGSNETPINDHSGLTTPPSTANSPVGNSARKPRRDVSKKIDDSQAVRTKTTTTTYPLNKDKNGPVQNGGKRIRDTSNRAGSASNIKARQDGDAIIGALFPLHEIPSQESTYNRKCGNIREHYGIQRVEAFIMTIEKINNDSSILPNVTLGWDIRDSCWYSAIALENSIDFIKDAIASQSKKNQNSGGTGTESTAESSNGSSPCKDSNIMKPIVGLIGPGSSESTIQVQNLLQIFNIPQIGYSATTMDLSDKRHYKYFLRVVPPDNYQARAIVDLVVSFNWTYISTVHTDGSYGTRGMDKFKDIAKQMGVCIAQSENIATMADDESYDSLVSNLMQSANASVVVCFCEGGMVRRLLQAMIRKNVEGRYLVIGSDGWGNRRDVVKDLDTAAAGYISMKLYSPPLMNFDEHYSKLTPDNPKNPWFHEFWESRFNCSLDDDGDRPRICTRNESLAGSEQDSKLGFVANAVMAMALALDNMMKDECPNYTRKGLCPTMQPLNGSIFLQYLLNVSFLGHSDEPVHFNWQGDPPGRYEILNYQPVMKQDGNISYEYVTIGHWITGNLTLNTSNMYWPRWRGRKPGEKVRSICSEPCKWGQVKKVHGESDCCWFCTMCLENEILTKNNTECMACAIGMWPDANKTGCEEIPRYFISWVETGAIVCITVACLGICVTLWVFAIFMKYNDTPIVKASTRELSYIILVGICLAFSSNFFIVAKPAKEFCYLTRIIPGLSFSLMYGALVTRTNRIARILEGSKRIMTKKPRFMSATAQVVITGMIIGIESAVIIGMLVYEPANSTLDFPTVRKVRLICDTSTLGIVVPLGFDLVLILLCTIYAVKTRNLPENFNEAKFIGFTMYSTCVIWLGFFPIYFAGESKEITLSISVSLSAAIALLLLFGPKVYVIVWVPEKNTRGAFTTSRDVRCHIGSKSMTSGDSIDIKFVMQRSGPTDGETPYTNHGVLPNHRGIKSSLVHRDNSSDSTKTELTPVSSLSYPDKDRLCPKDAANVEAIRQNLARDFPMHGNKKQAPLRPGSPAEREKHRIHTVEQIDLDEILNVRVKVCKPRDFRKSLSSTCVSTCPKTKNAQVQTSEDLSMNLLPPLRKRCVSNNKNKLERSVAVEDTIAPLTSKPQSACALRYPSPVYPRAYLKSPFSSPQHADHPLIPSDFSDSCPLVSRSHYERRGLCSLPDLDLQESSSLLAHYTDHHSFRRRSHQHPDVGVAGHRNREHVEYCQTLTDKNFNSRSPQTSTSRLLTPSASSDLSFLEGIEAFENSISTSYSEPRKSPNKPKHNLPETGISPSSQHANNGAKWCYSKSDPSTTSTLSLTREDSYSSTTASTASSSFTLPPFLTSTDSYNSELTLGESDDDPPKVDHPPADYPPNSDHLHALANTLSADEDDEELVNIHKNVMTPLMGNNLPQENGVVDETPFISLEALNQEESEVLEFHRYLEDHGVKLDLSTVQSSDV